MDRVTQLRSDGGGSADSSFESTSPLGDAYLTADSSKYFSISEEDSALNISPVTNISLEAGTSASDQTKPSDTSDVSLKKKSDLLVDYKIDKHIEAVTILSGGVNIFDDNENSYDGDELVIDDNADADSQDEDKLTDTKAGSIEGDQSSQSMADLIEDTLVQEETTVSNKNSEPAQDTEVILQIDGNNVNAIDIGNNLYLYRCQGDQEELAAVQILNTDGLQPTFKFLKVRENAEGNLEVYEEIVEVHKEVPVKKDKISEKTPSHLPIKDITKAFNDHTEKGDKHGVNAQKVIQAEPPMKECSDEKEFLTCDTNIRPMKFVAETRKSPLSITPMAFHSTPNKDGVPLTKTMVDLHLHPSRHPDLTKKTIEVNTDSNKQKPSELSNKIDCVTTIKSLSKSIPMQVELIQKTLGDHNKVGVTSDLLNKHDDKGSADEIKSTNNVSYIVQAEKSDAAQLNKQKEISINEMEIKKLSSLTSIIAGPGENVADPISNSSDCHRDVRNLKIDISFETVDTVNSDIGNSQNLTDIVFKDNVETKLNKNLTKKGDLEDPVKTSLNSTDEVVEQSIDNKLIQSKVIESSFSTEEKINVIDNAMKIEKVIDRKSNLEVETLKQDKIQKCLIENDNKLCVGKSVETLNNIPDANSRMGFSGNEMKNRIIEPSKCMEPMANENAIKCDKICIEPNISEISKDEIKDNIPNIDSKQNSEIMNVDCSLIDNLKEASSIQSKIEEKITDITKTKVDECKTKSPNNFQQTQYVNKYITEALGKNKVLKSAELIKSNNSNKIEPVEVPGNKVNNNEKPKAFNNNAVPFGKWTEANKQEYLNKIKENKSSTITSTTNQIKQPKDLNRRDVLIKIDSARQTFNLNLHKKEPSAANTSSLKAEGSNQSNKFLFKNAVKDDGIPKERTEASVIINEKICEQPVGDTRTEMFYQDIIDKTVEGIIKDNNKSKQTSVSENGQETKKLSDKVKTLDDKISTNTQGTLTTEKSLNLAAKHDTSHKYDKLSKIFVNALHNQSDSISARLPTKIPKLLPLDSSKQQTNQSNKLKTENEQRSEEEILECKPVTGDDILIKKYASSSSTTTEKANEYGNKSNAVIITENDFDKFARRNSITYENQITVKYDLNQQCNVVQRVIEKSPNRSNKQSNTYNDHNVKTLQKDEEQNTHYSSKLQLAYHSALTAKTQKEKVSPLTALEDKPVKVIYNNDDNLNFRPHKLNVQEKELGLDTTKRPTGDDAGDVTLSSCDSLDIDLLLDNIVESKNKKDSLVKPKHQRKQVLTPVDTPELELIEPKDLGIEVPKRKRRSEDQSKHGDIHDQTSFRKSTKSLVPKKSYLLGRNIPNEKQEIPSIENKNKIAESTTKYDMTKEPLKEVLTANVTAFSAKDTASNTIDSLVMAAELLEKQPDVAKAIVETNNFNQTVKRGRGRPRKYPTQDIGSPAINISNTTQVTPKSRFNTSNNSLSDSESSDSERERLIKENWTMGKINENIVCPICNKLFRSENVVFKHVTHCTGPSPTRSESSLSSTHRKRRLSSTHSGRRSIESKSSDVDNTHIDSKKEKNKVKSKGEYKEVTVVDEIIIIQDSPITDTQDEKKKKNINDNLKKKPSQEKTNLTCSDCGKSFRQLSHLIHHKEQHKQDINSSTRNRFSCNTCEKQFRKLHHLVQHRIIHNSENGSRVQRKTSLDHSNKRTSILNPVPKKDEDQGAGFRCEQCDKSFRKLYHLVEHRETHDGQNKTQNQKKPLNFPQCNICKKTFRKLHHLSEHKEQHHELNKKSTELIHECSLCYMVFPNPHSLEKHMTVCKRKKRQSSNKQHKQEGKDISSNNTEDKEIELQKTEKFSINDEDVKLMSSGNTIEESSIGITDAENIKIDLKVDENQVENADKSHNIKGTEVNIDTKLIDIIKHSDNDSNEEKLIAKIERAKTVKRKSSVKDVSATVTKKRKSTSGPLPVVDSTGSDDDDDVKYMLNPDYKEEINENKAFMKVRSNKRNSLQIERPSSKDLMKRRISLQHPPKIPRMKVKPITKQDIVNAKLQKLESVPSTSSDDSDIKYSFPKNPNKKSIKNVGALKKQNDSKKSSEMPKQRKSICTKRKVIGAAPAIQMPLEKIAVTQKSLLPKKRLLESGHRCDCGQLFGSAALLTRHHTLAHTPPRVRRRRSSPAPDKNTVELAKNYPKPNKLEPKKLKTDIKQAKNETKPAKIDAKLFKTIIKSKANHSLKANTVRSNSKSAKSDTNVTKIDTKEVNKITNKIVVSKTISQRSNKGVVNKIVNDKKTPVSKESAVKAVKAKAKTATITKLNEKSKIKKGTPSKARRVAVQKTPIKGKK